MPDDLNDICKICGGDQNVAKIANALGFRPDIAFWKINKLKVLLGECHQLMILCNIVVDEELMGRMEVELKD